MEISDFIKPEYDNYATFDHFRGGNFYYNIREIDGMRMFQFPISASAVRGTLHKTQLAQGLMSYLIIALRDKKVEHIRTVPAYWICGQCGSEQGVFHPVILDGVKLCCLCAADHIGGFNETVSTKEEASSPDIMPIEGYYEYQGTGVDFVPLDPKDYKIS